MKVSIRTPEGVQALSLRDITERAAKLAKESPSELTCAFRIWYEGFEGYGMPVREVVTAIEQGIAESGCWTNVGPRRFEKYGLVNAYTNNKYAAAPKNVGGHTMIQHRFHAGAKYKGPDGKIYWVPVVETFDLRCFEWQDGKYVGTMVEIDPDSDYARAMVEVK